MTVEEGARQRATTLSWWQQQPIRRTAGEEELQRRCWQKLWWCLSQSGRHNGVPQIGERMCRVQNKKKGAAPLALDGACGWPDGEWWPSRWLAMEVQREAARVIFSRATTGGRKKAFAPAGDGFSGERRRRRRFRLWLPTFGLRGGDGGTHLQRRRGKLWALAVKAAGGEWRLWQRLGRCFAATGAVIGKACGSVRCYRRRPRLGGSGNDQWRWTSLEEETLGL